MERRKRFIKQKNMNSLKYWKKRGIEVAKGGLLDDEEMKERDPK